jgi:hypothetical protein
VLLHGGCSALCVPRAFQTRWSPAADVARAADVEGPWMRAGYRSTRLVELDQKVAAPLAGGRRNSAGGEDLRG